MNLPKYTYWKLWLWIGVARALLFAIAAQFLFGYIVFLCPEPLLLASAHVQGLIWFLVLVVLDTLIVGYLVTIVFALFHRVRTSKA